MCEGVKYKYLRKASEIKWIFNNLDFYYSLLLFFSLYFFHLYAFSLNFYNILTLMPK